MNKSRKMGGVIALLASTIAVSDSALAINLTISNTTATGFDGSGVGVGQSFTNDPSGGGNTIYLNNWTFAFGSSAFATNASALILDIYQGAGNAGTLVGSSIGSTTTTFASLSSVHWDFNSLALTDNVQYTAVIRGSVIGNPQLAYGPDSYPNGNIGAGTDYTGAASLDAVFQGNFSATPVPFEFETTSGLAILGGAWLLRKYVQKKAAKKNV